MESVYLPKFTEEESVLCLQGPVIYDGKVLKREYDEGEKEYRYKIHYNGWNKNHDQWVSEQRILKLSTENLRRKHELDRAILIEKVKKKTKKGKKVSGNVEPEDEELITGIEPEDVFKIKPKVELNIPEQLQLVLVDDWDAVTRQKRLLSLPARISIETIFEDYLSGGGRNRRDDEKSLQLCEGLGRYFNTMIENDLLYRFEKPQYSQMLSLIQTSEKTQMTEIYGAQHLMRLISKLGGCLTYTNMDTEAISVFQKSCSRFLNFLLKDFDKYFSPDAYVIPAQNELKRKRK